MLILGVRVRYFAYHTPGTVPNMAKITKKMRNMPQKRHLTGKECVINVKPHS